MIPDVLIIGGGVIGLSAAWKLAQSGRKVRVIDRQELGREASWAGAGIIPPGLAGDATSWLGRLYLDSKRLWPEWSDELRSATGIDNGYSRCGGIELVDDAAALREEVHAWKQIGEPAEVMDERSLAAREPALKPGSRCAYHLPGLAQVRNPWHLRALQAASLGEDVEIVVDASANALIRDGRRVTACETSSGSMQAGQYIVAGGAWSAQLLATVGISCLMLPIRGQIVLLQGEPGLLRHVVECGSRYIVPRADGRILIGSTEEDAGFDKSTTPTAIDELRAFAADLVPRLSEFPIERTWAGLRPYAAHGPVVGRTAHFENLFIATGHFRSGLTLSPATAMLLVLEMGVKGKESGVRDQNG